MKTSKVILIVVVVLALGAGIAAVSLGMSLSRALPLDEVLARPGHHLGESLTVAANTCQERAPVFGHRVWELQGEDYEAVYVGRHAPERSGDRWIASVSVEALDAFGQTYAVLTEHEPSRDILERLRGLLPRLGAATPGTESQASEAVAIAGRVQKVGELLGFGAISVDVDGTIVQVLCEGYVPPQGAAVRVEGTKHTVLAGTQFATELVESDDIAIPISDLRNSPATYDGHEARIVGTVTSSYSLFGRSVYGVQDTSGDEVEVWSAGAGHAPGGEIAVLGTVQHVAGWGRHQIVVLIEQSAPDEDSREEVGSIEMPDESAADNNGNETTAAAEGGYEPATEQPAA